MGSLEIVDQERVGRCHPFDEETPFPLRAAMKHWIGAARTAHGDRAPGGLAAQGHAEEHVASFDHQRSIVEDECGRATEVLGDLARRRQPPTGDEHEA
jgi:hypothetical protein